MKKLIALAAFATVAAVPAHAANLYSNPLLQGETSSPGSASFSASSAGGAGSLSFNIDGFRTLDGVNFYEDDFTLTHNGTTILSLSYDLGGGGSDAIFTNTAGAVVTRTAARQLLVTVNGLNLAAGNNVFGFAYASPTGNALGAAGGHAGPQGIGDEGWGISNVSLTGAGGVPEPATWALMILGMGAVGGAMRRRGSGAARVAA